MSYTNEYVNGLERKYTELQRCRVALRRELDDVVATANHNAEEAAQRIAELETQQAADHEAVYVVFDAPPGPESSGFVETEDATGNGVGAGDWSKRTDGLWQLGPFFTTPQAADPTRATELALVRDSRDAAVRSFDRMKERAEKSEKRVAVQLSIIDEAHEERDAAREISMATMLERDAMAGRIRDMSRTADATASRREELRLLLKAATADRETARDEGHQRADLLDGLRNASGTTSWAKAVNAAAVLFHEERNGDGGPAMRRRIINLEAKRDALYRVFRYLVEDNRLQLSQVDEQIQADVDALVVERQQLRDAAINASKREGEEAAARLTAEARAAELNRQVLTLATGRQAERIRTYRERAALNEAAAAEADAGIYADLIRVLDRCVDMKEKETTP